MSRINFIVKVTDACNMRCKYCYNSEGGYTGGVLNFERLEKILKALARSYNQIDIIWHGGEPLTCGVDYYGRAMQIERDICTLYDVKFKNSVQTNATLIDRKWINLFKKYDIRPGLSFDGINNDKYRGKTEETLKAIRLLQKNGISFGALAVVVDEDYDLIENYKYFAERKIAIDFSHMFREGGGKELNHKSAEKFACDSIKLFDYWLYDTDGVPVRTFVSYIHMALGSPFRTCNNSSCHGKYLSVDCRGDLFNCSRSAIHAYKFANVDDVEEISEIWASEGFKQMLKGSIARRKACKDKCELFDLCQGGCADCAICEGGIENPPEETCARFIPVFKHVKERIEKILADKVPLDELNPAVKKAIIQSLAATDDATEPVTERYV